MDTESETPDLPIEILQAGAPEARDDGAWYPVTLGDAAWAMGKLLEAQRTVDAVNTLAATYHARVDEWRQDAIRPAARTVEFFSGHLERFALREREATGVKTIHLPSGRVETKKGRESTIVDDEPALTAWLKVNQPDAVKITEKPLLSAIRAAASYEDGAVWGRLVAAGGEIIPGVHVERTPIVPRVVPS